MSTENITNFVRRRTVNGVTHPETGEPVPAESKIEQIADAVAAQTIAEAEVAQAEAVAEDAEVIQTIDVVDLHEPGSPSEPSSAVATPARVKRKYTRRTVVEAPPKAKVVRVKATTKSTKVAKAAKPTGGKRGRKPLLDEAKQAKLKTLFQSGGSLTKASRVFKVSVGTARRYAHLWKLSVPIQSTRGRKGTTKADVAAKAKMRTKAKATRVPRVHVTAKLVKQPRAVGRPKGELSAESRAKIKDALRNLLRVL